MIIAFSGIDSSGKTTQIELLFNFCKEHNIKVKKVWSKARGTPGIMFLKRIFRSDTRMSGKEKKEYRKAIFQNPMKVRLLYIASIVDLCWYWGFYYRILCITNQIVVCDRYLWDTRIEMDHDFQGINIDKSILWKILRYISAKPKVSLIFVIPAEISLERDLKKKSDGIEEIEIKKSKIITYMSFIEQGCWTNVMDGMKMIKELHIEVLNTLYSSKRNNL